MKISSIEEHIKKMETELKDLKKKLKPKCLSDIMRTVDKLVSVARTSNLCVTEVLISRDIYDTLKLPECPMPYDIGYRYNSPISLLGLPIALKEDRYNHISIGVSECQEQ